MNPIRSVGLLIPNNDYWAISRSAPRATISACELKDWSSLGDLSFFNAYQEPTSCICWRLPYSPQSLAICCGYSRQPTPLLRGQPSRASTYALRSSLAVPLRLSTAFPEKLQKLQLSLCSVVWRMPSAYFTFAGSETGRMGAMNRPRAYVSNIRL